MGIPPAPTACGASGMARARASTSASTSPPAAAPRYVAIGDGIVRVVDNLAYGSGPHNLVIMHPNGYASLYGHLLQRPDLKVGQQVKKGDPIALTGDPDLTCTSRPHLHLEVRPSSLNGTVDAVNFIDANWDALALVGAFGRGFQRDLDDPRKWQTMQDQPESTGAGR